MPILPSVQHYITSEETEFEAPVSESVAQNYGEAINYLNDLFSGNFVEFTSAGPTSFVVPPSVTKVLFIGCGGGGAGGNGGAGATAFGGNGGGGGGGAGVAPFQIFSKVVGGDLLAITIGAGGSTNGADGASTTVVGTGVNISFLGGNGGNGGGAGGNGLPPVIGAGGNGGAGFTSTTFGGLPSASSGGKGSTGAGVGGAAGSGSILNPSGGALGTTVEGGGGGGGGAGAGIGGSGGNGTTGAGGVGNAPPATSYGAGGGGGAGGGSSPAASGGAGGAGQHGYLAIAWF